jgi:DNA-binding IclR family transcriptional regulator
VAVTSRHGLPDAARAGDGARPEGASSGVKSAYRTIQVLELLTAHPDGLSLSQLQHDLGIPKSSLHSLLQTLVDRGWLETTNRGTLYGIGLRALRCGAAFLERDPAVDAASVVLTNLRNHLDETFHLARLDECDVVYLVSKESMHHLRSSSRIGRRLPAHSTALGKALLAARPWGDVDALLPDTLTALTSETVVDRDALRKELAETQARGWAAERGQNTPGLGCFAVAVPSRHPPVDAISCSIPLVRLTNEHAVQVVGALTNAADELGHMLRGG